MAELISQDNKDPSAHTAALPPALRATDLMSDSSEQVILGPAFDRTKSADCIYLTVRGNIIYDRGDFNGAHKLFSEAVMFSPNNDILRLNNASAMFMLGNYEGAEAEYQEAERLNPNNSSYRVMIGACEWKRNNVERGIAIIEKVLKSEPDNAFAKKWLKRIKEKISN